MTGPHPAVAAARTAVAEQLADLVPGARVLVACSGGADSLALAAAAAFVGARSRRGSTPLHVGAVVVDHGLQPGSARVADDAARVCRTLGLDPVEVVRVDVDGPGGPEAAARDARYAALTVAAQRAGAAAVLLGHTRDDQAETVLLGLARGSGARSLAGMPARRGLLRRPFLGLRRADTEAVCDALGLEPWHDPTNAPAPGSPAAPRRSRVRTEVMPVLEEVLGPGAAAALARSADQLREDADALDSLAAELLAHAVRTPDDDRTRVRLDVDVLARALPAVRRRALLLACVRAGCPPGRLARTHVLAVDALVTGWHGQGPVPLPGPVEASRTCGRLALDFRTDEESDNGGSCGHG